MEIISQSDQINANYSQLKKLCSIMQIALSYDTICSEDANLAKKNYAVETFAKNSNRKQHFLPPPPPPFPVQN